MRRDPVTPELRLAVLSRDRACLRYRLQPAHECRDVWGTPHSPYDLGRLQLDHIQEGYGRMGVRAASSMGTLVSLCADAHLNGWATSHRPELREYLRSGIDRPTQA